MPLVPIINGTFTDASQLDQLINLLTGAMNDQAVTLKGDNTRAPAILNLDSVNAGQQVGQYFREAGTSKWGVVKDVDNSLAIFDVVANAWAARFSAGAAASGVSGGIVIPSLRASGVPSLGNALTTGRYIGQWTTSGAPTGLTAQIGDFGLDTDSNLWRCTAAGTPGTWKPVGRHKLDDQNANGVASMTLTVPAASVGLYSTLYAVITGHASGAGADTLNVRPNNDSGANYNNKRMFSLGVNATWSDSSSVTNTSAVAGTFSDSAATLGALVELMFANAQSTTQRKPFRANSSSMNTADTTAGLQMEFNSGEWRNAANAISSLVFIIGSGANLVNSHGVLYGDA